MSLSVDDTLAAIIASEEKRQDENIILIASENYVSPAVRAVTSSVLTNKYAEGYAGNRYYNGCENVDAAEMLACERAQELFGADYANVQPHSGSQANLSAYLALLDPGDTVLGMNLSHGGHLTHGSSVNFSGKYYKTAFYGVEQGSELINYEEVLEIARRERPKLIVCGASAYSRTIDFEKFAQIAAEVDAHLLADIAHISGPIAANLHPSPVKYADVITMSTHKTLRGPRGGMILVGKDAPNRLGKVAPKSGRTRNYSELVGSAVIPGTQGGPLMHVVAAKAAALHEALQPEFRTYQENVLANAKCLADELQQGGLRIVSGGTDNHLFLVDLSHTEWTGKDAADALDSAGITLNKNTLPFDTKGPQVTSGIRIGTPAVTTRGMGRTEMRTIAKLILDVLNGSRDTQRYAQLKEQVRHLTSAFPLEAIWEKR